MGEVGVERPINEGGGLKKGSTKKTFRNEHLNDCLLAKQAIS